MTFGIDVGTTNVAGVAVDASGTVVAQVTRAHAADVPRLPPGAHVQDPLKLRAAVGRVRAELQSAVGAPTAVGWTGQMHGVVGVDADLRPLTGFVTWRDRRRFGGMIMTDWHAHGRELFKCLPVCAWASGSMTVDRTFLHSWYLDMEGVDFPRAWLPTPAEGGMLGDNQAGVFAAQRLFPGCAVVNLGTSGQLSVVRDRPFAGLDVPGAAAADGSRREERPYPGGRTLECRASTVGGAAWAELRARLGLSWEALNDSGDPQVAACARRIADDLFGDIDLTGVTCLVGIGNALTRNPALRRAVEERSGRECRLPECPEMAAYGAALMVGKEDAQ